MTEVKDYGQRCVQRPDSGTLLLEQWGEQEFVFEGLVCE